MRYSDEFWSKVEEAYTNSSESVRQISIKFTVTEKSIDKRAKRFGWVRDFEERVKSRARKVANERIANAEGLNKTEDELIEDISQKQADLISNHRTVIGKHQGLSGNLLDELCCISDNIEDFEKLGEIMDRRGDEGLKNDSLNDIYRKVISLASRIDSSKKLAEAIKVDIGLERQAFGISNDAEGTTAPSESLESIKARLLSVIKG